MPNEFLSTVKDERKKWDKLKKELELIKHSYVLVGFQADDKRKHKIKKSKSKKNKEDALTVTEVAIINEFGTSSKKNKKWVIPSRPFMRSYYDKKHREVYKFVKNLYREITSFKLKTEKALKLLGEYVKSGVQENITHGSFKANAPSTIDAKNSSKPLINTGQMRGSVTYKIIINRREKRRLGSKK